MAAAEPERGGLIEQTTPVHIMRALPGPTRPAIQRQWQAQTLGPLPLAGSGPRRAPALATTCSQRGGGPNKTSSPNFEQRGGPGRGNKTSSSPTVEQLASTYAAPVLGLLAAAILGGPIIAGLAVGTVGVVAVGTALGLLPVAAAFLTLPLLIGGALFTGLFASVFLARLVLQLAVAAAILYVGARLAGFAFPKVIDDSVDARNATIDVEAETVDAWTEESKKAEEELRDFDELLRRREQFKQGGR